MYYVWKNLSMKGYFMRKSFSLILMALCLGVSDVQAKSALLDKCIEQHYMSDREMAKCMDDESERIWLQIKKKFNSIAATKYFDLWTENIGRERYAIMYKNMEDLRDYFCSLYGYAFTQDKGTISVVQRSQCILKMNERYLKDIDKIIEAFRQNS